MPDTDEGDSTFVLPRLWIHRSQRELVEKPQVWVLHEMVACIG
ncbi:hypothetical protein CFELI_03875 [Corynebacterium felinum]|uniref:Uncharacterized protein n=1 Tax=Corynebacterium felinum TaxID=131318 RepID=A0ABU2B9J1_9CORY|nr:hypothetical protein [Corynebacterium felinum]WJY94408.1 hypothetical protein CFELI_03875 [Corynebacterium felinum]